ncbi:MAG: DNA polymerase III, partial [Leptospirillum sp. Group IV 'UBA BS']
MAYQAFGFGLSRETVATVTEEDIDCLLPDLTVGVDRAEVALEGRLSARAEGRPRFERLGREYFDRVRRGYLEIARVHADRTLFLRRDPPPRPPREADRRGTRAALPGTVRQVSSAPLPSGSVRVRGHDRPMETVLRIVREGYTSGALLLWGPEGVGKRTAALSLCRTLLCGAGPERAPCGECPSCRTPLASHPDFRLLDRGEAASIGVDPVRALLSGTLEAPLLSPLRAAVIDEAHLLTPEGANSLLKTLEEPAG